MYCPARLPCEEGLRRSGGDSLRGGPGRMATVICAETALCCVSGAGFPGLVWIGRSKFPEGKVGFQGVWLDILRYVLILVDLVCLMSR
jgi:hypothetical protein